MRVSPYEIKDRFTNMALAGQWSLLSVNPSTRLPFSLWLAPLKSNAKSEWGRVQDPRKIDAIDTPQIWHLCHRNYVLCSAVCSSLVYVSGISCKLQQKTEIKDKITHAQLSFMLKHLRYRVISIHVQFYQDPVWSQYA